ncbi:hypothetical protein I7I53_08808 [Histoplasma capsulatum var. duboisii H88]|uniref:Uncharacterized protein n=1 Tax=Ajellomyces capsulatus (strain H88) TaxID=544711 RepID=A0A8A1LAD7_AJEC8|nr:hypothetical protein I7I53_08808 [Histoplasma capsulatum var. duboisii H88]
MGRVEGYELWVMVAMCSYYIGQRFLHPIQMGAMDLHVGTSQVNIVKHYYRAVFISMAFFQNCPAQHLFHD